MQGLQSTIHHRNWRVVHHDMLRHAAQALEHVRPTLKRRATAQTLGASSIPILLAWVQAVCAGSLQQSAGNLKGQRYMSEGCHHSKSGFHFLFQCAVTGILSMMVMPQAAVSDEKSACRILSF